MTSRRHVFERQVVPALRGALAFLLVGAISVFSLHVHDHGVHGAANHHHGDGHDHHHGHDHQHDNPEAPKQQEAPCQVCIVLAGGALPAVSLAIAVPQPVVTQPQAAVDATPRSLLSWSSRLLRAPPQAA